MLVCLTCSLHASGAVAAGVAALAQAVQGGLTTHHLSDLGASGVDAARLVSLLATALVSSAATRS